MEAVGLIMISFDEAVEVVRRTARPLGTERVCLDAAAGRVLASSVRARIASPRSDVSAMDGYAVRDADLAEFPVSLKVVGISFAGTRWNGTVGLGECAGIFTGARGRDIIAPVVEDWLRTHAR